MSMHNCKISHGEYGRKLEASASIHRNHICMEEKPLICVSKFPCNCSKDFILSEFILIAWSIAWSTRSNHIDDSLMSIESYNQFINEFQSGFDIRDDNNQWSIDVQILLIIISLVCCVYTEYQQQVTLDPMKLLQILSRIPLNVHAISKIISNNESNSNISSLQQEKLGFALFQYASSINHSCNPNANIRYKFENPMNWLSSFTIQVVSNAFISNSKEICISYGPMKGIHSYTKRQETLQHQYLFNCQCNICLIEKDIINTSMNQSRVNPIDKNTIVLFRKSLDIHYSQVIIISEKATIILQHISNSSISTISTFIQDNLIPIELDLILLHDKYFHRYESINILNSSSYNSNSIKSSYYNQIRFINGTKDYQLFSEFVGVYTSVMDLHARCLAFCGQLNEAIQLIDVSIVLMIASGRFPPNDVAIARERVKLAQLLFSIGDFRNTKDIVIKAINDLQVHVSEDDPDLQESMCMLQYLAKL